MGFSHSIIIYGAVTHHTVKNDDAILATAANTATGTFAWLANRMNMLVAVFAAVVRIASSFFNTSAMCLNASITLMLEGLWLVFNTILTVYTDKFFEFLENSARVPYRPGAVLLFCVHKDDQALPSKQFFRIFSTV